MSRAQSIWWGAMGSTRRGRSHVDSGLKNQDAFQRFVSPDGGTAVLAVADGHGSPMSFRADVGSSLAVGVAVPLLRQFADAGAGGAEISAQARAALATRLTHSWREAVLCHLDAKPFNSAEWDNLSSALGDEWRQAIERDPPRAYGSTLLAVLATQTYVFAVQLGDGDILFVNPQGHTRRAIPPDRRAALNQTASLAQAEAAAEVRSHLQEISDGLPAVILAATDGYGNSFRFDHELMRVGWPYLQAVRGGEPDTMGDWLEKFVDEAAKRGSEDDITVGVIAQFEQ